MPGKSSCPPKTRKPARRFAPKARRGPEASCGEGRYPVRMKRAALMMLLAGWVCVAGGQPTVYELDGSGWIAAREPEPGSDEAMIAESMRLLAEGKPGAARSLLRPWVKRHRKRGHPLMPQALLALGDAKLMAGNPYQALFDYEDLLTFYAESPEFFDALERELEIGKAYAGGTFTRRFLGILNMGATRELVEELLTRVAMRAPGSDVAERAHLELADYYYRTRDLTFAAEAYELFVTNFPQSRHRAYALQRQILANLGRFKGPRHDASVLVEASGLIDRFRRDYPLQAQEAGLSDALQARIDESLGAQMLEAADWYQRRGDLVAARFQLQRLVVKHPRTVAAARGRELLALRGWEDPSRPAPVEPPAAEVPTAPAEAEPDGDDSAEATP